MQDTRDVEQIWRTIDALDLEPIKFKLMHPEGGPVRTQAGVARAERGYRQFLKLTVKYPDLVLAPSREIDDFWHGHILDTLKYAADCEQIFGFFLHHNPYLGVNGPEDEARLFAAHGQFNDLVQREFGIQSIDEAAYCAKASVTDAAYCAKAGDKAAAYCAKAGVSAAAYCAKANDKAAAYCAKAGVSAAAYCAKASDKAAAYCAKASVTDAAYCAKAGNKTDVQAAAYCAKADESAAAYCAKAAVTAAYCAKASEPAAAYCAKAAAPAAAYCAKASDPARTE